VIFQLLYSAPNGLSSIVYMPQRAKPACFTAGGLQVAWTLPQDFNTGGADPVTRSFYF